MRKLLTKYSGVIAILVFACTVALLPHVTVHASTENYVRTTVGFEIRHASDDVIPVEPPVDPGIEGRAPSNTDVPYEPEEYDIILEQPEVPLVQEPPELQEPVADEIEVDSDIVVSGEGNTPAPSEQYNSQEMANETDLPAAEETATEDEVVIEHTEPESVNGDDEVLGDYREHGERFVGWIYGDPVEANQSGSGGMLSFALMPSQGENSFALGNLILAIFGILLVTAMVVRDAGLKRRSSKLANNASIASKYRSKWFAPSIIVSIVPVILLIYTQSFRGAVIVWFDWWTLFHINLFAFLIILCHMAFSKKERNVARKRAEVSGYTSMLIILLLVCFPLIAAFARHENVDDANGFGGYYPSIYNLNVHYLDEHGVERLAMDAIAVDLSINGASNLNLSSVNSKYIFLYGNLSAPRNIYIGSVPRVIILADGSNLTIRRLMSYPGNPAVGDVTIAAQSTKNPGALNIFATSFARALTANSLTINGANVSITSCNYNAVTINDALVINHGLLNLPHSCNVCIAGSAISLAKDASLIINGGTVSISSKRTTASIHVQDGSVELHGGQLELDNEFGRGIYLAGSSTLSINNGVFLIDSGDYSIMLSYDSQMNIFGGNVALNSFKGSIYCSRGMAFGNSNVYVGSGAQLTVNRPATGVALMNPVLSLIEDDEHSRFELEGNLLIDNAMDVRLYKSENYNGARASLIEYYSAVVLQREGVSISFVASPELEIDGHYFFATIIPSLDTATGFGAKQPHVDSQVRSNIVRVTEYKYHPVRFLLNPFQPEFKENYVWFSLNVREGTSLLAALTDLTVDNPAWSNNVFWGWHRDAVVAKCNSYTPFEIEDIVVTSAIDFTAQWMTTFVLNANGGETSFEWDFVNGSDIGSDRLLVGRQLSHYLSEIDSMAIYDKFSKADRMLRGFNTEPDGYANNSGVTVSTSFVLDGITQRAYAQWVSNATELPYIRQIPTNISFGSVSQGNGALEIALGDLDNSTDPSTLDFILANINQQKPWGISVSFVAPPETSSHFNLAPFLAVGDGVPGVGGVIYSCYGTDAKYRIINWERDLISANRDIRVVMPADKQVNGFFSADIVWTVIYGTEVTS